MAPNSVQSALYTNTVTVQQKLQCANTRNPTTTKTKYEEKESLYATEVAHSYRSYFFVN